MALSRRKEDAYNDAINFFRSFMDIIANLTIGDRGQWKPVQTGILISTTSIINMAEDILYDQPFFLTSRVTQDCLENLFSCVRYRNPDPTAKEFKAALKAISVAQYLKPSKYGSYDDRQYLGDLLPSVMMMECCL